MQQTRLPGTDLTVSRLAFGTASLLSAGGHKAREAALHAALDAGFTHFDTAPLYGFGNSERDLGRVLGRRADCTVATKVGLRSPGGDDQGALASVARKALGRFHPPLSRARADLSLDWARRSLEGSLRRLGRETIDLFLLHDPDLAVLDHEGWRRWLEDVQREGKVRHFGIAGLAARIAPFLERQSPLAQVIQIGDSIERREADVLERHGREMQLTYGYVRGSTLDPSAAMRQALARNTTGSVLYSSRKPERIAAIARLAS